MRVINPSYENLAAQEICRIFTGIKKINMNIFFDFLDNVFVAGLVSLIMGIGLYIGWDSRTEHRTNQLIKPSITIINVDGVVDTTYTYTFE